MHTISYQTRAVINNEFVVITKTNIAFGSIAGLQDYTKQEVYDHIALANDIDTDDVYQMQHIRRYAHLMQEMYGAAWNRNCALLLGEHVHEFAHYCEQGLIHF